MKAFKELTSIQRRELVANGIKQNRESRVSELINRMRDKALLIDYIMTWDNTPQGQSYWNDIHMNTKRKIG